MPIFVQFLSLVELIYGRDNQLAVEVKNTLKKDSITVFTASSSLTRINAKTDKPTGTAVPLPPHRALSVVGPNETSKVQFQPRPELEPGEYQLDVTLEVISPVIF